MALEVLEDVGYILEEAGFKYDGEGRDRGTMSRKTDLTEEEELKLVKEMGEVYFCFLKYDKE